VIKNILKRYGQLENLRLSKTASIICIGGCDSKLIDEDYTPNNIRKIINC
jgi:hypothetical protein